MSRGFIGCAVLAWLSAGCAQWAPSGIPTAPEVLPAPVRDAGWWMEVRDVQSMPKEHQVPALSSRSRAYEEHPSNATRVRLAVLRAVGSSDVRDEGEALALLDEVKLDGLTDPELRSLVTLLRQLMKEKAELRVQLASEREKGVEREQRIEELQQQLEALTSIEQSIQEREKRIRE
jgi:hypothetical protein